MLSPLEQERNELGYHMEKLPGVSNYLRVIHRPCQAGSSDKCLFLVHGGGGRAGQFKYILPSLESHCNVVTFDFLGHGDSPKIQDPSLYTADQHLQSLRAVYEKYKMKENYFLSHCYGSIHTLRLLKVLRDEGRQGEVAGVCLMSVGATPPSLAARSLLHLPVWLMVLLRPLLRSAMNSVTYTPSTDPAIIELEDSFATPHRVYMMKVFGSEIADKRKLDQWRREGKYGLGLGGGTDPIPASFICSDGDHLIPFKECKEFASFLQIPDHRFHVVERCGHKIMLEAPGRVVDIILSDLPLKSKL